MLPPRTLERHDGLIEAVSTPTIAAGRDAKFLYGRFAIVVERDRRLEIPKADIAYSSVY
jgi:hypothetical protein